MSIFTSETNKVDRHMDTINLHGRPAFNKSAYSTVVSREKIISTSPDILWNMHHQMRNWCMSFERLQSM